MSQSFQPSPAAIDARAIWQAGISAADAYRLVSGLVRVEDGLLHIGDQVWPLHQLNRICIVGAGKATVAMMDGLFESLRTALPQQTCIGQINVPAGHEGHTPGIQVRHVRESGENLPTSQAVTATREMLGLVQGLRPEDLCIALISGGGSALLTLPVDGIDLEMLVQVTRHLSAAGCDIRALNAVRQCLDEVKAGGLARHCHTAHRICLVLSDIIGDPLDLIASGPMYHSQPDPQQAIEILARYDPQRTLPDAVYKVLDRSLCEDVERSVDSVPHLIAGNVKTAVSEAARQARLLGYQVIEEVNGESLDVTQDSRRLLELLASGHGKCCVVSGGEPTVRLADAAIRGLGGRNQQLVLHALQIWRDEYRSRVPNAAFLSGGTDGEDGNTRVAGAWFDRLVDEEARCQQLQLEPFLHRNDAFHFFEQAGGLLDVGVTQTNVCDLRVVLARV